MPGPAWGWKCSRPCGRMDTTSLEAHGLRHNGFLLLQTSFSKNEPPGRSAVDGIPAGGTIILQAERLRSSASAVRPFPVPGLHGQIEKHPVACSVYHNSGMIKRTAMQYNAIVQFIPRPLTISISLGTAADRTHHHEGGGGASAPSQAPLSCSGAGGAGQVGGQSCNREAPHHL